MFSSLAITAWLLGATIIAADYCCTWEYMNCGPDDYCNAKKNQCVTECGGKWIDLQSYNPGGCCLFAGQDGCYREYPHCDAHSSQCTKDCAGTWLLTSQADPQPGQTQPAPQPAAQQAPTPPGSYPGGPYISLKRNSESITLPNPRTPNLSDDQTQCPHWGGQLLNWYDRSTWGSAGIPREGQDVNIPSNVKVLVTETITEKLGFIYIPESSELIIGQNRQGIHIRSRGFNVKGKLTIGSETCRIQTLVVITLHGSRPSNAVSSPPLETMKGINVDGGILNLHGKRYFSTWSRLAKTVLPGDDVVMLQSIVNWKEGQKIVLVTSALQDSRDHNHNEVRTIKAVHNKPPSGVGAVVYLTEPVQYKHISNKQYQVEVGLLSRNIVIQGAEDDSEPVDKDPMTCAHKKAGEKYNFYYQTTQPCANKELTGYGGHVIVRRGGKGHVEGVELYRMGQTNVLGRYPMHFHKLGQCATCYFKDSSVHHSYYRCVSIHGTNKATITENVGYDVTGYCYYLEAGVEEDNTISFNLAAHIHMLGHEMATGPAQRTPIYYESSKLTLPADVTASGFYITNTHNHIEGNAASGGWAGFALPSLPEALGDYRSTDFRPANAIPLIFDGNTAHSSGWWWKEASPFYFGGALYYGRNNKLEYNPGRSLTFHRDNRRPCYVNACAKPYNDCAYGCPSTQEAWMKVTNTKSFLTAGVGLNSWSGRMEVLGFEAHDVRLAMASLSSGFWADNLLVVCRTGEDLGLRDASRMEGSGFFWYDTAQAHIITDATFRNCGYRSSEFAEYDTSPSRGCSKDDKARGCADRSTVFALLTHSDQHTPEIMQATRGITFDNCGRRFMLTDGTRETVSGRAQNWLDIDGSASGLGRETIIASGLSGSKDWWQVDDNVIYEPQAPLRFIKKKDGPKRSIAHFRLEFDNYFHDQVGSKICGNGPKDIKCNTVGYIRHLGHKFSPYKSGASHGLPVTYNPDVVGLAGGYGWVLNLQKGAPHKLVFNQLEIDPSTTLMVSIPYPRNTEFDVYARGPSYCWVTPIYECKVTFNRVNSIDEVRKSRGNTYHVDNNGVLTIRLVESPDNFVGDPDWVFPTYQSRGRDDVGFALPRFEREGILLPDSTESSVTILAKCPNDRQWNHYGYCSEPVKTNYDPDVCSGDGYVQVAYDKCCKNSQCEFA